MRTIPKLAAVAAVILALPAAMCTSPEAGVEVRTVEVVKEMQKPCPGTVPPRPAPLAPLASTAEAALAQVLAKLAEWSGEGQYGDRAEAYFETCPPGPAAEPLK